MNSAEAFQPNISVRNYQTADRDCVYDLLSFLPNLYPRSFDWLEQRLTDIEHQRAHCTVALINQHITGILIDTPKGIRCSKISTLYVQHEARSHGLGTRLFQTNTRRWHDQGIENVYVTVSSLTQRTIAVFLRSNGFTELASLTDRYGPGRHEFVYSLKLG